MDDENSMFRMSPVDEPTSEQQGKENVAENVSDSQNNPIESRSTTGISSPTARQPETVSDHKLGSNQAEGGYLLVQFAFPEIRRERPNVRDIPVIPTEGENIRISPERRSDDLQLRPFESRRTDALSRTNATEIERTGAFPKQTANPLETKDLDSAVEFAPDRPQSLTEGKTPEPISENPQVTKSQGTVRFAPDPPKIPRQDGHTMKKVVTGPVTHQTKIIKAGTNSKCTIGFKIEHQPPSATSLSSERPEASDASRNTTVAPVSGIRSDVSGNVLGTKKTTEISDLAGNVSYPTETTKSSEKTKSKSSASIADESPLSVIEYRSSQETDKLETVMKTKIEDPSSDITKISDISKPTILSTKSISESGTSHSPTRIIDQKIGACSSEFTVSVDRLTEGTSTLIPLSVSSHTGFSSEVRKDEMVDDMIFRMSPVNDDEAAPGSSTLMDYRTRQESEESESVSESQTEESISVSDSTDTDNLPSYDNLPEPREPHQIVNLKLARMKKPLTEEERRELLEESALELSPDGRHVKYELYRAGDFVKVKKLDTDGFTYLMDQDEILHIDEFMKEQSIEERKEKIYNRTFQMKQRRKNN